MKSRLLLFSLVSSLPVSAADFQWDPNGATTGLGGAGTWDTTSLFWDATATGINDGTDVTTATTFTTADKAIFGGTGGAVSVGTAVSLNQLSVNTTGYSFTGSKITFGGTAATLTANADFTIANAIGGDFNKLGSGAVTITGETSFNTVTVSAGTLTRQASVDNVGSASIVNGGTLILASTAANSTSSVTLNTGTVRLNGTNDVQIWNGGTLTINGGTFEQNGKNETVGSLILNGGSITGSGTLTSNSVIDARSGSSATILGGTLGLTKTTAGTLTLTAANTYTGTTTISGGTILVGNGGSTGSLGVGALVNNGTLTYNLVGANTVATLGSGGITGITGSGSTSITADTITFGASGGFTATTSGNQSYIATRNTTVYPKGMVFGTSGAYNFTTTGGASITMKGDIGASAASTATVNLDTSSGNGAINLDISVGRSNQFYNIGSITANAGTGAINWTGTYGDVRGSDSSQSTPITLTGAINMTANFRSQTLQTLTLNATGSSTVTGNLLGTINLVKGGSQNLTLSGANTYTGFTNVNVGTVKVGNIRTFGSVNTAVTKVVVASGATVDFNGQIDATYGYTISGTGVGGNGALVNNGAEINTGTAQATNIRLADNASIGGTGNWALLTTGYAATSLDLNAKTLTKVGSNTVSLVNTTTTAGTIQVSGGTLALGVSGTVNGSASAFTLDNTAGANLSIGANSSVGSLAGGGTTGGNTSIGSGATLTVGALNTNTTYSGVISGAGSLAKTGTGILTLSAANTFTGNVLVSNGELQTSATNNVRSLGANNAGRTVTVSSGATLKFLGSDTLGNAGSTPNVSLLISGTVTSVASKLNTLGNVTLTGGTLSNLGGLGPAYQAYSLAGSVTVNGSAASSISGSGSSTGVHLGTNTSFNVGDATGSAAADLTVSVPLVNRNGDLGGAGGLTKSGAGTMTLSAINTYTGNTTVSAGTLEVGGSGQLASGTYAGDISNAGTLSINTSANQTLSGAITGAGSLVKGNTGTLTLSGNSSTYTGTTTVSAGTLLVSGQLGGNTSVSSAATISGGGTVGGNLSFLTGSLFDISSALTGDALSVGGTVTFGTSFGIDDLAGVTWGSVADGTYTLIDTTGTDFSLAGLDNFGLANAYDLGDGRSAYFDQGSLQLVVIPEPASALLGGLGLLVLLRRRRN